MIAKFTERQAFLRDCGTLSRIDRVFLSNSCFRFWRFPFRNSFQIFHRFASKQIFWQRWIVLRVYYRNCRNTSNGLQSCSAPPLPIFVSHFTLFRSIRFRFYYFCIIHGMNKCIKHALLSLLIIYDALNRASQ